MASRRLMDIKASDDNKEKKEAKQAIVGNINLG